MFAVVCFAIGIEFISIAICIILRVVLKFISFKFHIIGSIVVKIISIKFVIEIISIRIAITVCMCIMKGNIMEGQEKLRAEIEKHQDWLELEKEIADLLEMDFRLEAYFQDTLGGINFQQMVMFFREGDAIAPKTIVEIGSRAGTSSTIFGALAKKHDGVVYCIDPQPHSLWQFNMEKFGLQSYCIMQKMASPWVPWARQIDMLLIDANHDFLPCLVDFYYWYGFVRSGGLIIFHDTQIRDGVKQAMKVAEELYPIEQIARVEHGTGAVMYRKMG